jgi:outer membrane protein with beta-barrel domain
MKKIIIITVIAFLSIRVSGQEAKNASNEESGLSLGYKFNGGASEIMESFTANPFGFVPDNMLQFAYNFGILTHYEFDNRNGIGLEILFNRISGMDHLSENYIDGSGDMLGSGYRDIQRHISYLSIPVYYTYSISRWRLGIGVQTSFVLASNDVQTYNGTKYGVPYYYQESSNDLQLNSYDIGPKLCVFYQVTNAFFVNADYYLGITQINNNMIGYSSQSLKNEELSIGVGMMIK